MSLTVLIWTLPKPISLASRGATGLGGVKSARPSHWSFCSLGSDQFLKGEFHFNFDTFGAVAGKSSIGLLFVHHSI